MRVSRRCKSACVRGKDGSNCFNRCKLNAKVLRSASPNDGFGGFKLGFWMAQQGSIYVFVVLIAYYAWRMNRLDRKYGVHED